MNMIGLLFVAGALLCVGWIVGVWLFDEPEYGLLIGGFAALAFCVFPAFRP